MSSVLTWSAIGLCPQVVTQVTTGDLPSPAAERHNTRREPHLPRKVPSLGGQRLVAHTAADVGERQPRRRETVRIPPLYG